MTNNRQAIEKAAEEATFYKDVSIKLKAHGDFQHTFDDKAQHTQA